MAEKMTLGGLAVQALANDFAKTIGTLRAVQNPAFAEYSRTVMRAVEMIADELRRIREGRLTVTERLQLGGWQAVDPHELTPDERWEYQRWILTAPARWVRWRFSNFE